MGGTESMIQIVDSICVQVTSGTTLSCSIDAEQGDIILATITARDDFTLSEGWNLLYTSSAVSDTGTNQYMSFSIHKVLEKENKSLTVTQKSAQRLYINLIVVRGISDIVVRKDLEKISNTKVTEVNVFNKLANEKFIWGCSAITWSSGNWKTNPEDLDLISMNISDPRQANFIDLGNGVVSRKFILPTSSVNIICAVELITYAERYFVRDADNYYTISDNELILVDSFQATKEFILNNGMSILPNSPCVLSLADPTIVYWNESEQINLKVHYSAVPKTQVIGQNYDIDFSHESIASINNVQIHATLPSTSIMRFAVSLDSGLTWYAYKEENWIQLDINDFVSFMLSGMTKEIIEGITNEQWISFVTDNASTKYRFAILIDANNTESISLSDIVVNYINV